MKKNNKLKLIKTEPAEPARVLPGPGQWEDWFDEDKLKAEWETRMRENEKPKPRIHREIVTETLPHLFSAREKEGLTQEIIEADETKEVAESELEQLKEKKKIIEGRIKEADQTIRDNLKALARGSKELPTDVEKTIHYDDGLVTYVRMDTGEELRTRPISNDERQMKLVA